MRTRVDRFLIIAVGAAQLSVLNGVASCSLFCSTRSLTTLLFFLCCLFQPFPGDKCTTCTMSSVVQELRRNDPTVTEITIMLWHEPSDADLAQALERNAFVTKITIVFGDLLRRFNWPLLVRAIAARETLTDFRLNFHPAPALLLQFLNAANANANVKKIDLSFFTFVIGSDLFAFCARLNASVLVLHSCDMADPAQCEPAARALSANTAVKTLVLRPSGTNGLLLVAALLRNLVTSTSVKTLCTDFGPLQMNDDCSSLIGSLLEATTTLERFEFGHIRRLNGEKLTPIARGLINSASVCNFNISRTSFNDESARVFQEILQDKENLASLSLKSVFFKGENESGVLESIATALTRPHSQLRCLEYESALFSHPLQDKSLLMLLRAVEKSKLHRFKIGMLNSQLQMQSLTQMVPSLRLQELEITFRHFLDVQTMNHEVLGVVKKNFSLRSVKGFYFSLPREQEPIPLFNQVEDQRRLAFYLNRNERLGDWVDNVERLDRKLWPHAIGLAEQAGRDTLFASLQSVLGKDYVNSRTSGRKRKRT